MISVLWIQLGITLCLGLLTALFVSPESAIAFAVGSLLALTNFVVVFWSVRRIFEKKQVARSSSVIIFKYLILGLIIYFIMTQTTLSMFWIGAGLISLPLTLVLKRGKFESAV